MRTAIYIRVSIEDQAKEGFSLAVQCRNILNLLQNAYNCMQNTDKRIAVRDLQGLVESNQIKCEGIGKGTKYKV